MDGVEKTELLRELRIDRNAPDERSSTRGVWIVVIAVLLAIGAGAWYWLSRPTALVVGTATARPAATGSANASVLDATGYVTARRAATVSAKITGKVREVLIEEGMRVEQGQVLATLDDVEAKASLSLAVAQLEQAKAQVADARAQLTQAKQDLARQEELAARQLVSASVLDAARAQSDALAARLATAQRGVDVATQSVNVYQVQLDNMIVRAPFSGVITVKAAQPGEMISPISAGGGFTRTGIGTVVDMDSLEVQVDVNEAYINRVKPGQPVEAVLNAYPDWRIPASVIAIVPTADRSKATVKVRIALKEKDDRIVPDMGVRVSFLEDAKPVAQQPAARPGVLVPADALRRDEQGADIVYVVKDGTADRRAVKLGGTVGTDRVVTAGLAVGETVITNAPADLAPGALVTPSSSAN